MKWDELIDFPQDKIELMRNTIEEYRRKDELAEFVNPILREDIFDILAKFCTVVYFPLEDNECNDGFGISCPVSYLPKGETHFVFINTNKPSEKQVFTAAHELGHIWEIPKLIWDGADLAFETRYPQSEYEEPAINRFAAELLMPEQYFAPTAKTLLNRYRNANKIRLDDFTQVVSVLMNSFCVPAKAVILRLYETKRIKESLCRLFIDKPETDSEEQKFQDDFDRRLDSCIEGRGFTRLGVRTKKKGIRDFPQHLNEVEKKHLFSQEKVQALRKKLEIDPVEANLTELDMNGNKLD